MITKCFKKWTVRHFRALEDWMNNVEQWLVNKEAEKEKESKSKLLRHVRLTDDMKDDLHDLCKEFVKLQG